MTAPRSIRILVLVLALAAVPLTAWGAGPSGSRFSIAYELFEPGLKHDGSLRIDSAEFGIGTSVDLERDLGLEEEVDAERIAIDMKLGQRLRLFGSLMETERTGAGTLERTLLIGDFEFSAGVDAISRLDFEEIEAAFGYSLLATQHGEIGLSLGAHLLSFDASVQGVGRLLGVPGLGVEVFEESASEELPIVTLGAYFRQDLPGRLTVSGEGRVLVAEIEDYSADYLRLIASIEYKLSPRLALGAGYYYQDISVESDDLPDDTLGAVDFDRTGTNVFLRLSL